MPDETTIKRWLTKWGAFLLIALLGGLARETKDRIEYKTMFMTNRNA